MGLRNPARHLCSAFVHALHGNALTLCGSLGMWRSTLSLSPAWLPRRSGSAGSIAAHCCPCLPTPACGQGLLYLVYPALCGKVSCEPQMQPSSWHSQSLRACYVVPHRCFLDAFGAACVPVNELGEGLWPCSPCVSWQVALGNSADAACALQERNDTCLTLLLFQTALDGSCIGPALVHP